MYSKNRLYSTHCFQFVVFIAMFRDLSMANEEIKDKSNRIRIILGKRIRNIRISKGLPIAEVAYKANIDSQNLRKYELGKQEMKISMLFRVAEALDVKPEELVNFDY